MKKLLTATILLLVILTAFIVLSPFVIINEGEHVIVTRFGAITDIHSEAGLKWKNPFSDTVIRFSKKLLSWDGEPRLVPTQDKLFINIDTVAWWKITDPRAFYESMGSLNHAYVRLDDIIGASIRSIVTRVPFEELVRNSDLINEGPEIESLVPNLKLDEEIAAFFEREREYYRPLTKGREHITREILAMAKDILETSAMGIELVDIKIRHIGYSDDIIPVVYEKMIAQRKVAKALVQVLIAEKEIEFTRTVEIAQESILSKARTEAEKIKTAADEEATRIYIEAFKDVDPEFFELFLKDLELHIKNAVDE